MGWSWSAARRRRRWPPRPAPAGRPRWPSPSGPAPVAAWPAGRPAPAPAALAVPAAPPAAPACTPGRPRPAGPPGPRHSAGTMPACPRPWCLAHDPQVARGGVEAAAAVVGADDDVLDPGPVVATGVDAGPDREGPARLQRLVVAGDDVGVLVLLQPDPVAGPVHEQLAVAAGGDRVAAGGVDGGGRDPGPDGGAAGQLGGVEQCIQLLEPGWWLADDQGPGGVGA